MAILLGVSGFDINRSTELTMVNANIDVQKSDVGRGSVPGKVDRIATVEPFKKSSEGVSPMGPDATDALHYFVIVEEAY